MASALKPEMRVRLLLGDVCCWGDVCHAQTARCQELFLFEGVLPGGQSHGQWRFHFYLLPFLLTTPGTAGRSSRKRSGCARNSKELIVGWEQPRLQLEARSLVVLTRM